MNAKQDSSNNTPEPTPPGGGPADDDTLETGQDSGDDGAVDSPRTPADRDDSLPAVTESGSSSLLVLGQNDSLEISGLAPEQVSALRMQYAQGMIDVQKKATELRVDVDALDHTLRSLTSQTESATRSGVSITATHSQTTSLGRTEIILGNTDQARRGKLSRLQSGAEDNPVVYVAVLAGAIIFGALLIALLTG